jgi:hypothetical protein
MIDREVDRRAGWLLGLHRLQTHSIGTMPGASFGREVAIGLIFTGAIFINDSQLQPRGGDSESFGTLHSFPVAGAVVTKDEVDSTILQT